MFQKGAPPQPLAHGRAAARARGCRQRSGRQAGAGASATPAATCDARVGWRTLCRTPGNGPCCCTSAGQLALLMFDVQKQVLHGVWSAQEKARSRAAAARFWGERAGCALGAPAQGPAHLQLASRPPCLPNSLIGVPPACTSPQLPGDIVAFRLERQLAPLPAARVQDILQRDASGAVRVPQKLPASNVRLRGCCGW